MKSDWNRRKVKLQLALHRMWRSHVSQPWRRRHLGVYAIPSGLGDEIMAAGVVQAVKRANPDARLVFHARHEELFSGMEGVAEVRPIAKGKLPAGALGLTYSPKHELPVMAQMASYLGLAMSDFSIRLPRRPDAEVPQVCLQEQPVITIQTTASNWTPNKQWPESHWRKFVESLPVQCVVVELGTRSIFEENAPAHPGYRSLLGQTTLGQYAAAIQASRLFVGPVSAGMHLAHAYGVQSSIIIGGYELAHPYPLATQFYRKLPCSPCWLRDTCNHGRKCLQEISPDEVLESVLEALRGDISSEPTPPA